MLTNIMPTWHQSTDWQPDTNRMTIWHQPPSNQQNAWHLHSTSLSPTNQHNDNPHNDLTTTQYQPVSNQHRTTNMMTWHLHSTSLSPTNIMMTWHLHSTSRPPPDASWAAVRPADLWLWIGVTGPRGQCRVLVEVVRCDASVVLTDFWLRYVDRLPRKDHHQLAANFLKDIWSSNMQN